MANIITPVVSSLSRAAGLVSAAEEVYNDVNTLSRGVRRALDFGHQRNVRRRTGYNTYVSNPTTRKMIYRRRGRRRFKRRTMRRRVRRPRGIVDGDASDRLIHFYVDEEGNTGKSWMCRYLLTKYPDRVQVLRIGKRDDLACAIDCSRDIFLFDIPRTQMTYLQYSVLESLKDRMVFSPKYESSLKILRKVPHVIVFSNEAPDESQLSADRFDIYYI